MTSITYRLPGTQLVVTGVIKTLTDELTIVDEEPKTTATLTSSTVKLVTSADLSASLTLSPPTGWYFTYKGSFGIAPDGRLTAASSDVTGEGGAILKSLASLAGTALSIAALAATDAPKDDADNENIAAAYLGDYPKEHAVFMGLRRARRKLGVQLADEIAKVADGGGDLAELRRLRALLAIVGDQLVAADAHFRAWRSSKITTVEESFELRVALVDIPASVAGWGGGASVAGGGVPTSLEELWKRYGIGVEASWLEGAGPKKRADVEAVTVGSSADVVYTRVPELLELRLVKPDGARVVETGRQRAMVADDRSTITEHKLEKSFFGRKSLALTFDGDGFVSNVAVEGSSGLAAGLSAATGAVEGFTGGVEGGTKAFKAISAAGSASLDAELARVTAETGLREKQLLASGLDATSADAVELKRLEQLQGILDAQTKISGVNPALVAELAKRADGDLAWYRTPLPAPAEPQVIRILMGQDAEPGPAPPLAAPPPPPALDSPPDG